MLLLLLCLLPAAGSSETSPGVVFKPINQSCPESGYYFERQRVEPPACYLCFCKDDHAVCSLRADASCDSRLYIHQKSETGRVRRASGWTDVFRDTPNNVLNTKPEQPECQPNSSKSIGCPPADWCKGCTVCDCAANGSWDCHLMAFCDKKVKKSKKAHKRNKDPLNDPNVKNVSTYKTRENVDKKRSIKRKMKKYMKNPNLIPQISVETTKTQKGNSVIIKRYISTISPIKSPDLLKYKNNPSKLAELLYRQYMSNMSKEPSKTKKRTITDTNHSSKTAKMKGIFKKNKKQNKMTSEKSMNVSKKKHKKTDKLMKNKNKDGKMENQKQLNKNPVLKSRKYMVSKYNTSKRAKRDVSVATEMPINVTNSQGVEAAKVSEYTHQFTNGTEVSFTTNEDIHANLSNYAYTVDSLVTTSMNNNQRNASQYDKTDRQENKNGNKTKDIIKINDMNSTTSNDLKKITVTEKMRSQLTTDRGLKLITVYTDILKKTQLMNDQNYEHNVTIKNATNDFVNNISKIFNDDVRNKKKAFATKRFNLKKLVKTLHSRIRNTKNFGNFMNKSLIDNKSTRIKINGTLNDIQRLIEKMLHGATKIKKTNERLKTKSFAAIKYLKKLLSKLFSRSKNKTELGNVVVLNSICETFGPCRINEKKMKTMNIKIKELISETLKALRSIKIIKGLLQLLNVHNDKTANNTTKEHDFKIHLKKLNAILKEEYSPGTKWTQTQITQVNAIKSNTHIFIKSIGNFATILNDIISIIKPENEKINLKPDAMIKNRGIKDKDVISKMKRLLLKYNLIQNIFLRKMYGALTNVEDRVNNRSAKELKYKNEPENNMNYKIVIEKYVENINENLKKIKELAARIDSKTRRKRDARDDNAVEYLLTLMEYLLKRNNPLDTPPVNDGIDLLIEAIRRAPDIKPIKKPVLQYVPIKAASPANSAVSREESDSKSKDNSKEDTKKSEESAYNDIEYDDQKKTTKKDVASTTITIQDFIDLSDVITEFPSKVYMASFNSDDNREKSDNETASIIGTRKNDDKDPIIIDDDNLKMIQKAEFDLEAVNEPSSTTVPIFKEQMAEEPKLRYHTPINEPTTKEPKTKLDLINEAYEQEIKQQNEQEIKQQNEQDMKQQNEEEKQKEQTTTKPVLNRVKGETGKRERKNGSADVSCISKEVVDEEKEKQDTEKVVHRKQMEFLNSLDYGTDKSLLDDSDSKDNSPVDRLGNEGFQTY